MPLLGKDVFVRQQLPPNINPETEVFVCKTTREAFLTYDEFFERQILCSSMVWTCTVSGRTGLTYVEAVECERTSIEMLSAFPTGLTIPTLFLIRYLTETSINTIVDMIYQFINNRYFIAEEIETIINTKRKSKGKVFRVIFPNQSEIMEDEVNAHESSPQTQCFGINPMLYKYEIIDTEKNRHIVGAERLTRTKGLITKDKLKLFLRQHLSQSKRTDPWLLKESSAKEFNLPVIGWDNIFSGPEPNFSEETLIVKTFNKDKQKAILDSKRGSSGITKTPKSSKTKTMAASVSQSKSSNKKNGSTSDKKSQKSATKSVPKSKTKEETKQSIREREKEQKLQQKLLEKEQKRQFEENMKEWSTKRDDLACDDLRPLPEAEPLKCQIPVHLFADAVAVMEFIHCFNDLIDLKSIFPLGITLELMEQMVTDVDVNGPFADLIKVLITTNFTLQQEEDESEQRGGRDDSSDDESKPAEDERNEIFVNTSGDKNSVYYYNWIQNHLGLELSQLSLDAFNITEVLRLYLLSSGGGPQPHSKYRGLYNPREDPSVEFVSTNAAIMKTLEFGSIFDLNASERLKIFHVLINQLVTYFEFRDQIDDSFEEISKLRKKIRDIQTEFNKWTKDNSLKRLSVKSVDTEAKNESQAVPTTEQLEEYRQEKSHKETDMLRSCGDIRAQIRRLQACYGLKPVGYDRAYRRYWLFESLPGLFVEHMKPNTQYSDEPLGPCLTEPTPNKSLKPNHSFDDNNRCEKRESSQTNLSDDISTTSDKENDLIGDKLKDSVRRPIAKLSVFDKCTANINTCAVHGSAHSNRCIEWTFYYSSEDLSELISSLNCRGFRESELMAALNRDRHIIEDYMSKCQPNRLNTDIPAPEARRSQRIQQVFHSRKRSKHSNIGLGFNECLVKSLRDYLLTLEERIVSASLALVSQRSRDEWKRLVDGEERDHKKPFNHFVKAILELRKSVRPMCLSETLSDESPLFANWSQSLTECTNISQILVHMSVLESSIKWGKSALRAYCKICRRKCDAENMLLCDRCNRGHHTYCLQPSLDFIPAGEWLCPDCCPKIKAQTPKKNKNYSLNSEESVVSDAFSGDTESQVSAEFSQKSDDTQVVICAVCDRTDDYLQLQCAKCHVYYHTECAKVRRVTRNWFCNNCSISNGFEVSNKPNQLAIKLKDNDDEEECGPNRRSNRDRPPLRKDSEDTESQSSLESMSSSDNSEDVVCGVCDWTVDEEQLECSKCHVCYHKECANVKRITRSEWFCRNCSVSDGKDAVKKRKQIAIDLNDSDENESTGGDSSPKRPKRGRPRPEDSAKATTARKAFSFSKDVEFIPPETSGRRRLSAPKDTQPDLPLDRRLCESILKKLQRHSDGWIFRSRTNSTETRYNKVVKHYIDLGRIVTNLNERKYSSNIEFFRDVLLMINNAVFYNNCDSLEYKACQSLAVFFEQLVGECGIDLRRLSVRSKRC